VARFAEGLPVVAVPEERVIAPMRNDMVGHLPKHVPFAVSVVRVGAEPAIGIIGSPEPRSALPAVGVPSSRASTSRRISAFKWLPAVVLTACLAESTDEIWTTSRIGAWPGRSVRHSNAD
jgi:hypothetical protein